MKTITHVQSSIQVVIVLLLAACQGSLEYTNLNPDAPVADFYLTDVNQTSTTANQAVSPRDYLEHVSGWYFGHST